MRGKHHIFRGVVGSQAYGTSTPQSDVDVKGVYVQHPLDILSTGYVDQYQVSKDESHFEVRRFAQLLGSANPTVLELLYSPPDCVLEMDPLFDAFASRRDLFLTKACELSFGGYAIAQIRKARGLDKKMNYERERTEQKSVLDFCSVLSHISPTAITYSRYVRESGLDASEFGLTKIDGVRDGYALFCGGYGGILTEGADDVRTVSVPKGDLPVASLLFNRDGYSKSCAEWKSYQTWLSERNEQRYVDVAGHGQRIDGKNMLHCRRLLDVAAEIATEGTLNVRRPNAAELLAIRRGEVRLDEIIEKAERDIAELKGLFARSGLPDGPPSNEVVDEMILESRGTSAKTLAWPPTK